MQKKMLFAVLFVLLVWASVALAQGTPQPPEDNNIITTIFGDTFPDVAISIVLAIFIFRSAPAIIGLVKSATQANSNVAEGVLDLLESTLQGMQKLIDNNTNALDRNTTATGHISEYLEQRDKVIDARLAILEENQKVMVSLLRRIVEAHEGN